MTARSATPEQQRADEMRARILAVPEAWAAIRRPIWRRYDPVTFTITDDDRRLPFRQRDPRAIEFEYDHCRERFWSSGYAGEVRLMARRAVQIARYLSALENDFLGRLERDAERVELEA